jgi:hypothetical protein
VTDATEDAPASLRQNYYNYFTEVEETFVRRRGAHMLVSPMDWALIETWKEVGVPLHIVLRAIERAFDAYDARPHRFKKVNTIFYCQQQVESCYSEYRQSLVGAAEAPAPADGASAAAAMAPAEADEVFPKPRVEAYLARGVEDLAVARARAELGEIAELAEAVARAGERLAEIRASVVASLRVDAEGLERDLTALEGVLIGALLEHAPAEKVEEAKAEAKAQLKAYRKGMDKEVYRQTVDKFVARRLREIYHVPRLSLFFMG